MESSEAGEGHRVAFFRKLPEEQVTAMVGIHQLDPPVIVIEEGCLEELSEDTAREVQKARGNSALPSFFYSSDLDLDSSLDSETGFPRLHRRHGHGEIRVKELVVESDALTGEQGQQLVRRALSGVPQSHRAGTDQLVSMLSDPMSWADLVWTLDDLEADSFVEPAAPSSAAPSAPATVSISTANAAAIGELLERCRAEGGELAVLANQAEHIVQRAPDPISDRITLNGEDARLLQEVGGNFMDALRQREECETVEGEIRVNKLCTWAARVLDAVIPVATLGARWLTEEEERILDSGRATDELGAQKILLMYPPFTCTSDGTC